MSGVAEKKLQGNVAVVLALAATILLWVLLSQIPIARTPEGTVFLGPDGALGFLEEKTFAARLAARGSIPSPAEIIYVNVDTASLERLGNFPWSRGIFAAAIDALFEFGGIKAVGIDFVFSEAGIPQLGREEAERGSLLLGKTVRRYPDVVLAAAYGGASASSQGPASFPYVFEPAHGDVSLPEMPGFPIVGPTWGRLGLINTVGDRGILVPFFAETDSHTYYPLALELALIVRGVDRSAISIGPTGMTVRGGAPGGDLRIPLLLGQIVEPNWFSPWDSEQNPRTGIAVVLAAKQALEDGTSEEQAGAREFFASFRDAIVLIGPSDPLLKDVSVLPMNRGNAVPRVSIHGNLLKTLLSERFLRRPPVWANVMIIAALGLIAGVFCFLPQKLMRWGKIAPFVLLGAYIAGAFYLFSKFDFLLPIVAPSGAALSCFFVATVMQLSREQRQKRMIRELFGSYVSSAVVDEMVEREIPPQTGGAEIEITAFFSDIVSFSPIAEQLPPADLVALMSEYLGEGTAAVMDSAGTLDKYVGDAIVSIFGAPLPCPGHAAAACRAALALQEGQVRLRVRWSAQTGRWPSRVLEMSTRVGLHTGPAVVGNIGSKLRFNYTMMGDTVNLAQRIEAAAAYYGSEILVSAETYSAAIADDPALVFRPLDRARVPGRTQPVDLYELLGRGADVAAANEERLAAYAAAREIYRRGDWSAAREAFERAAVHEPGGRKLTPSAAMARRCMELAAKAPETDFVFAIRK